jgi:hypothetical protein
MSTTLTRVDAAATRQGRFWAFVPVVLLVASVGGVGSLVAIAVRDPGFALEKNYYERAVHWDREREQVATNERLGYGVALSLRDATDGPELEVGITDRAGVPLPGAVVTVEAFANARSGERRVLRLVAGPDGLYRAPLGSARAGLWEFRIDVLAGSERFTRVVRADVTLRRRE